MKPNPTNPIPETDKQLRFCSPYILPIALALLSFLPALAQDGGWHSRPMLGYSEHFEQAVLLHVARGTDSIQVRYSPISNPMDTGWATVYGPFERPYNPIRITLAPLEMDTEYTYTVFVDGEQVPSSVPQRFKTRKLWEWREDAPDFSFLFGSCLYANDERYDRPGRPYGQGYAVVGQMQQDTANFTLWGGDNVYLREVDWSSPTGIYYRYYHVKREAPIANLLATRPNYAVVDDHDMGPNNSNRAYRYKDVALEAFKDNWGNNTYGMPEVPGAFGEFEWSDCDFFLLDNRYHRSPPTYPDSVKGDWNPEKAYLGKGQMQWLKDALANSRATFKFIVSGSQVLNTNGGGECFCHYKQELTELLEFIKEQDVRGVVFLSGDRHLTEVLKVEQEGMYPLYEFTSSPISAGPFTSIAEYDEFNNPLRIEGTLYPDLNYMKFEVSGERGNRVLKVTCKDKEGETVWTRSIEAKDLRLPR